MVTAETIQSKEQPRILVINRHPAVGDFVVREIPYDASLLAQQPGLSLDEWLSANHRCPCPPRKSAEEELAKKVEELARSNRELEQFAFVASHDLQEPLRMVTAYTQLLAEKYRGKLDENADRYIAYASEGALRLQTLIQDLLAFSRVNDDNRPLQEVDSSLAVAAAVENLRHAITEAGALIQHGLLPRVFAHRSQLVHVFQNLICNAIKFRRKEPPVVIVQAVRDGHSWVFSVSDNGIGIEAEHSEAIFQIFHRLHTRTEHPGNGIGLAICRRVIERFGGRIWLESRLGEGSTFKFTLPAVSDDEGEAQR